MQICLIQICEKVTESIRFEIGYEIRHIPIDMFNMYKQVYQRWYESRRSSKPKLH